MSIKIMDRVWRESESKGGARLTLLAIADNCDDDGLGWPGISTTLVEKTNLTHRAVTYNLESLLEEGDLIIYPFPGSSHDFIVTVGMSFGDLLRAVRKLVKKRKLPIKELRDLRKDFATQAAKNFRTRSEARFAGGAKSTSQEPSGNRQEPSAPKGVTPPPSDPVGSPPDGGAGSNGKPAVVHEDDLTQTDDLFYAIACEIFDFQTKTELAAAPSTRSRVNAVVKAFRADHPTATGSDIRAFKQAWQAKEGSPDLPKGEQTLPDNYRTWQKEQVAPPAPSGPRTISLVEEGETV